MLLFYGGFIWFLEFTFRFLVFVFWFLGFGFLEFTFLFYAICIPSAFNA
jgi:hypothetical protein